MEQVFAVQELLDIILSCLDEESLHLTARFPTLTAISRTSIIAARQVRRCWFRSHSLRRLFAKVLEQKPFIFNGHYPWKLDFVVRSAYAPLMTTLSLGGMDKNFVRRDASERWGPGKEHYDELRPLVPLLAGFFRTMPWLKHLRYYPIHPKIIAGQWPT
ncbi:hypothetical protein ACN47E_007451 [Coniothyrium glycines]